MLFLMSTQTIHDKAAQGLLASRQALSFDFFDQSTSFARVIAGEAGFLTFSAANVLPGTAGPKLVLADRSPYGLAGKNSPRNQSNSKPVRHFALFQRGPRFLPGLVCASEAEAAVTT
jgi:hypothetical protein